MPSAREVIAKVYSGAPFPSKRSLDRATDVLDAFEAAGFRIIPPGEYDPVTVERAAAWHDKQASTYLPGGPKDMKGFHRDAAAALRSLKEPKP